MAGILFIISSKSIVFSIDTSLENPPLVEFVNDDGHTFITFSALSFFLKEKDPI